MRILGLPVVVSLIHQALRQYDAGLELSDQNATIQTWGPFTPTGKLMPVATKVGFGKPAIVELQKDDNGQLWETIDIVNLDSIDMYEQSGKTAVCFYGSPAFMRFSWDPTTEVPTRQVRVYYDGAVADPAALNAKLTTLPDYYLPMVACRVALDCIPDLMDRMPNRGDSLKVRGARLEQRLAEWERMWDHWRFEPDHQGPMRRLPFNRNRPGWRFGYWRWR